MICSYDETLLYKAQTSMAHMLDTAVYSYGYDLSEYYDMFLTSDYSSRFERGESSIIAGMSGNELAYAVISEHSDIPIHANRFVVDRSREYWIGWSISYYQWKSAHSFKHINDIVPINDLYTMYPVYHEMDINQFADHMDELDNNFKRSAFKRYRLYAGLSQRELAERTGIPIRTIQQYEQGQKNIAHARTDVVVKLCREMYCNIEDIL